METAGAVRWSTIPIDLRLRTTSTGLQDVGTRDSLRVLVQAYVAWQVPGDSQRVRQFLRSVRNQPDEAARQLRSFVSAELHIISSNFDLTELVNIDPNKVRLDQLEQQLRDQIAPRMLEVYGIDIRQVGIERMTLPDETLAATVARMRAERETVAAQRTADGLRQAAAIRADADRDAREVVAAAREQAAHTEANAQQAAARIYSEAYRGDPGLYTTLRSLDSIGQVIGRNTSVVLRTDAAPFRVLVDGPAGVGAAKPRLRPSIHAIQLIRPVRQHQWAHRRRRHPDRLRNRSRSACGPFTSRPCCWRCFGSRATVREIASDSQAVVLRFGRIVRSQETGLLLAWPRPIEQVRMLPGPQRQLSQDVAALPAASDRSAAVIGSSATSQALPQNVSAFLTGDGNLVLLNATLLYRINDPIAYALSELHVRPALDRLFRATMVRVTAGRNLNDFLVVQTNATRDGNDQTIIALRSEARNSLLQLMNARLQALNAAGAPLGVEIERIDMTAWLPPRSQIGVRRGITGNAGRRSVVIAVARTDAERRRQEAEREREQLVSAAPASAQELVESRQCQFSRDPGNLEHEETPLTRSSLLMREYRLGVANIMNRIGSVTLIDPQSGVRFVLPGK